MKEMHTDRKRKEIPALQRITTSLMGEKREEEIKPICYVTPLQLSSEKR